MMTSQVTSEGQEAVECGLCQNPVSFFCRHCGLNLCDSCIPVHLRVKSKFGHDVVDYASKNVKKDDDYVCFCDSHPENKCSAYCTECDVPICILCVSIKHRSHEISELYDKVEELLKDITQENGRLQSFRHEMKTLLDHTTKQLSSLSSVYQKKKDEVSERGNDWHKLIDNHVKKLHQELGELKKENKAVLQKQKREFEEMIGKMDEMDRKTTELQKSNNVTEMQKFRPVIREKKTLKEFIQYTFPTFYECEIEENYMQTYFGYIEKLQEKKIPLLEKNVIPDPDSGRKVLEAPSVSSVIDTGFPGGRNNNRLYDMAVTDDQKVWMGGESKELKLFDLQGHLHLTVTITALGMYICMYNKQVVYTDTKAVKKISDDDTVVTMFATGDWEPYGITGSASVDLLVCLRKGDQSKVVRYSSTGTVLQEIQYDSQCQPLYQYAWYITENVNGDIIVTGFKKRIVIVVDRLGIFRYTYSGRNNDLNASSVATDSVGHVYVTDCKGDKIHMLDRDGRFLRYIIPEGRINLPRPVCMIGDGEMIVGERDTGLAKRIKFLEEKQ
uniref:Protein wech-like n=1 Tax=Crassostrea virginica TaxID=6565 RepID=A0A8B8D6F9_CRAVI|nr:protein wech-like [Crassostrea virginica]